MAKLYPPHIEGTIPAFCKTVDKNGTARAELVVPFSMNKAVSKHEVRGFDLKLKNIFGAENAYLITLSTEVGNGRYNIDSEYTATFDLSSDLLDKLLLGQFYKVQIAYIGDEGTGYYSTVGVVKYTSEPTMEIANLSTDVINMHRYSYIGRYSQVAYDYTPVNLLRQDYKPNIYYIQDEDRPGEFKLCMTEIWSATKQYYVRIATLDVDKMKDATEKEYSYRFLLTDFKGAVIADSGYLIHNSSNDTTSYESQDEFAFPSDLKHGKIYYLQYSVKTNNGMEVFSPKYRIMQKRSIAPEIDVEVKAIMNYNNGYVDVNLVGQQDEEGVERGATGSFLLTRSSSDDNFQVWNEVLRFGLYGQKPSRSLFRDFTVEQGKTYIYSLQQYNDTGLYSARIKSNEIQVDFEDAFLFDGERQLKIKFNPKVTSFKDSHLESKVDTIGSQYPFIFRNGNVSYKEFPLAGLISYQSDEENLFMSDEELGLTNILAKEKRPGTFLEKTDPEDSYFENLFNLGISHSSKYGTPITHMSSEELKKDFYARKNLRDGHDNLRARTTSLSGYNIAAERTFKLNVLDWLNNGKAKLFRSPAEGNYLVRLMNVTLSPEEKTGRMLHTFNSQAYEIAECTYDNLNAHGIISIDEPHYKSLRFESIRLAEYEDKSEDTRYEANFGYEMQNLTEEQFNARMQAGIEYYRVNISAFNYEPGKYYQWDGSEYKIAMGEEMNSNPYYLKDIGKIPFYTRTINILGKEIYTQLTDLDEYDFNKDYYIRKTNGHLYYAKPGVNLLGAREVTSIRLTDMMPGDKVYIQMAGEGEPSLFMIGATGAYLVDTGIKVIYFGVPEGARYTGTLTYSYYEDTVNLFNEIENVEITSMAAHQFIGGYDNILSQIENVRDSVINFYYLNFYKRTIGEAHWNPNDNIIYRRKKEIYSGNGNYLYEVGEPISDPIPPHDGVPDPDIYVGTTVDIVNPDYFEDPFIIYHYTRDYYLHANARYQDPSDPNIWYYHPFDFYYDPFDPEQLYCSQDTYHRLYNQGIDLSDVKIYKNEIQLNNHIISLEEIEKYFIQADDLIFNKIATSCGVAMECGYELQSTNFSLMRTDELVAYYYEIYLDYKQTLEDAKKENVTMDKLKAAYANMNKAYDDFIGVLTETIRRWEASQEL